MPKVLDLIWGAWEQIFFGKSEKNDSTALSTTRPTGKSLEPVFRIRSPVVMESCLLSTVQARSTRQPPDF
jgi:hypothetical protein